MQKHIHFVFIALTFNGKHKRKHIASEGTKASLVSKRLAPVCCLNNRQVRLFPNRLRRGTFPVNERAPKINFGAHGRRTQDVPELMLAAASAVTMTPCVMRLNIVAVFELVPCLG